jgi:hypothetical protein
MSRLARYIRHEKRAEGTVMTSRVDDSFEPVLRRLAACRGIHRETCIGNTGLLKEWQL